MNEGGVAPPGRPVPGNPDGPEGATPPVLWARGRPKHERTGNVNLQFSHLVALAKTLS